MVTVGRGVMRVIRYICARPAGHLGRGKGSGKKTSKACKDGLRHFDFSNIFEPRFRAKARTSIIIRSFEIPTESAHIHNHQASQSESANIHNDQVLPEFRLAKEANMVEATKVEDNALGRAQAKEADMVEEWTVFWQDKLRIVLEESIKEKSEPLEDNKQSINDKSEPLDDMLAGSLCFASGGSGSGSGMFDFSTSADTSRPSTGGIADRQGFEDDDDKENTSPLPVPRHWLPNIPGSWASPPAPPMVCEPVTWAWIDGMLTKVPAVQGPLSIYVDFMICVLVIRSQSTSSQHQMVIQLEQGLPQRLDSILPESSLQPFCLLLELKHLAEFHMCLASRSTATK